MFLLIGSKIVFLIMPYFVGKYTTFLDRPNSWGMFGNILYIRHIILCNGLSTKLCGETYRAFYLPGIL